MRASLVTTVFALLLTLSLPARGEDRTSATAEGLVVRVDPGYAMWSLDAARVRSQTETLVAPGDVEDSLVTQTQDAFTAGLELGYNIKGHVTLSVALLGTGWDVAARSRGGAGFAAGLLTWHPAELIPGEAFRHRKWDASLFFGAGYGVVGEIRALDGLHLQYGARAEYFPTKWLSVGLGVRNAPLMFSRYVIDWNNDESVPLPRNSGGSVLIPSLTFAVHAPLGG